MPRTIVTGAAVAALAATWFGSGIINRAATGVPFPVPSAEAPAAGDPQVVVFAGGCFWGVQAVFQYVKGVLSATSGYAGGTANTATYQQVSTGRTRHAESVRVVYDPSQVSFGQLLRIFFSVVHDPTQLNRQGLDHGPEYRSAIWFTTARQQEAARAYLVQLTEAKTFARPLVTEINALRGFFPAEEYHQDYLIHHRWQPYIVINDIPKVRALQREFPELWRDDPVGWQSTRAAPLTNGASR